MTATTTPDDGNHMVNPDNDCLNALSLSILSHEDLSAAAMKMIPSCRHHELVLIAAYLLRGDQHLDERKKLAKLITGNPTNEKENESTVARGESADKIENGENVQHGKDADTNGDQEKIQQDEEGIVVQKLLAQDKTQQCVQHGEAADKNGNQEKIKLLAQNTTQQSSQVESTPKTEANPATRSYILLWENKFQELLEYKAEHGHFRIPQSHKSLQTWVQNTRQRWRENRIPEHRLKRLQAVGFFEDSAGVHDEKWEKRFAELIEFKAVYGHCDVPRGYPNNPQLGNWVKRQREMHTMQNLAEDRVQRLEALGFRLNTLDDSNDAVHRAQSSGRNRNKKIRHTIHDEKWEKRFAELIEFRAVYGHCDVPRGYPNNPQLGNWVKRQREMHTMQNLAEDRVQRLEALGFRLNTLDDSNDAMHRAQSSGRNRNKKISATIHDEKWERRFADLVEFKANHGHCEVPRQYPNNPPLGHWAKRQREMHTMQNLAEDRIQRLEALGFRLISRDDSNNAMQHALPSDRNKNKKISTLHDEKWEKRFAQLVKFKANHGHCEVPRQYPNNPQLGHWAKRQREYHNKQNLAKDRVQRLEALGFRLISREDSNDAMQPAPPSNRNLNAHDNIRMARSNEAIELETPTKQQSNTDCNQTWDMMYEQLIDYQDIHGNVDVPENYEENVTLSHWVDEVRRVYRRGELREDQIRGLNEIGFSWNVCTFPKMNVMEPITTISADIENETL